MRAGEGGREGGRERERGRGRGREREQPAENITSGVCVNNSTHILYLS